MRAGTTVWRTHYEREAMRRFRGVGMLAAIAVLAVAMAACGRDPAAFDPTVPHQRPYEYPVSDSRGGHGGGDSGGNGDAETGGAGRDQDPDF